MNKKVCRAFPIGDVSFLKYGFQRGESCKAGAAKNILVTIEIASAEHAGELVFPREARSEIELKVVLEAGGFEASVALLS